MLNGDFVNLGSCDAQPPMEILKDVKLLPNCLPGIIKINIMQAC
jgi:hypothetical protein